jgi:hypothetical protein
MTLNTDFKDFDLILAMNNKSQGQDLLLMNNKTHSYEVLSLSEFANVRFPGLCRISEKEFLIFGGSSSGNILSAAFKLNIETKQLEKIKDTMRPISKPTCILFDRKVFVFGGKTAKSNNTAECSAYDLDTKTWLKLPDIPYSYNQIMSVFGYEEIICLALNDSKFVCFDPTGNKWFFWRVMFYPFDKVCAYNNKLYLINDDFKAIYEYDIKNELVQIFTMINFDYDEFISFENSGSIIYLNHSLNEYYFYEVKFSDMSFTKYEADTYNQFFSQYILLLNSPNQYVFPKGNSIQNCDSFIEIGNSTVTDFQSLKKANSDMKITAEPSYSHVFGGHVTPFHLLINRQTFTVTSQAIPSRLELKNLQGVVRLDDTDTGIMLAGGSRQDSESYGSIDAFSYSIKSNSVVRIQELNSKSKITWLTKVKNDVYLLNETKFFQRYDILKNKWYDMKPCLDDFFYNNFVYNEQLFTFISQKNKNKGYDFVVMCFDKEANNWTTSVLPNVDFIVTADFSYKVGSNKYIIIGHPLNDKDPNTIPYIYEMTISEDSKVKFVVSIKQVCKLTSTKTKSVRVVPFEHEKKLLFNLIDLANAPFPVIYDIEKQAPGQSEQLTTVYNKIRDYLMSIRFDFKLFENLNNVA